MTSKYGYMEQGYTNDAAWGDRSKNDDSTERLHHGEPTKQMRSDQEHAEKECGSSPRMHNLSPLPSDEV